MQPSSGHGITRPAYPEQWQALADAVDSFDEEDELPPGSAEAHATLRVKELADKSRALRNVAVELLEAHTRDLAAAIEEAARRKNP